MRRYWPWHNFHLLLFFYRPALVKDEFPWFKNAIQCNNKHTGENVCCAATVTGLEKTSSERSSRSLLQMVFDLNESHSCSLELFPLFSKHWYSLSWFWSRIFRNITKEFREKAKDLVWISFKWKLSKFEFTWMTTCGEFICTGNTNSKYDDCHRAGWSITTAVRLTALKKPIGKIRKTHNSKDSKECCAKWRNLHCRKCDALGV